MILAIAGAYLALGPLPVLASALGGVHPDARP